ncbi:hypothetical protein IFR05_003292 [Cadophora sp. M221]|nr:hypothetical protein IFR05_003292 [Cadophora sp. M221]
MIKSHEKSRAKKESKTDKLNTIGGEWRRIQEKLDETNNTITSLEAQYQTDATSRQVYQKSTYQELSAAYDKRDALSNDIEQKKAEYKRS